MLPPRNEIHATDCLTYMRTLDDRCVDLVFGSPPYEAQRTYGIGFNKQGQEWVDWMVELWAEMQRISRGVVAMVVEGKTKQYRYSATPLLLSADLHRAGFNLRKPLIFHRVGIPGSGGPDWLRNDFEFVVCTARPGKLHWSDNTACGHPPKWAPGGAMSNRHADGRRINAAKRGPWGETGNATSMEGRKRSGEFKTRSRSTPSQSQRIAGEDGSGSYLPPKIANPGNVIKCRVGGGQMGHDLAHNNEAPFPESLAEFFVRSFCPPGGIVFDPFMGSGTTAAVALKNGRDYLGTDVRESQVEIARRRIADISNQRDSQESAGN